MLNKVRSRVCVALVAALGALGCDADATGGGGDPDAAPDVAGDVAVDASPDVGAADPGPDATADVAPDVVWPDLLEGTVSAVFTVRPGVETATVLGAEPDQHLTLYARDGSRLLTMIADEYGQAHFAYIPEEYLVIQSGNTQIPVADGRTLKPGDGYVIRDDDADPVEAAAPFSVLDVHTPDPSLYDGQELHGIHYGILGLDEGEEEIDGFNYITMRDGVQLSAMVRFPDPIIYGDGPYATVIEYSGYSTSRPDGIDPGSRIATLLGFATVGVNMRGTGCSGGVFDVFNPAQHADGYDVVEVVARQPWVLHNKVGMVGLSYSGIAQLFVARTRPPSLAAILPLSVLADPWQELWPGGIYNEGFTRQWLEQRDSQAASNGQHWTAWVIADGDTACEAHQLLRNQNIEFESFFKLLEFYPADAADRSLPLLVSEIDVPVYLTGAWHDEQTGAQFANMLDHFTGVPTARFTLFNGRHVDGYSPLVLTRWYEFLQLYVARTVPRIPDYIRALAGPELAKEFGVEGLGFEDDRFTEYGDDEYDAVRAAYEAEPRFRVLFESGAAGPEPGAPKSRFEVSLPTWPPPDAEVRTFWFAADGALADAAPAAGEGGVDTFLHDPEAGSQTFFGPKGYQLMVPLWDLDWTEFPADHAVSYVTPPLAEEMVVAGPGWAELWVASEASDAQVQVTITEVRPDDTEYLVQTGWLRLGHRKVDEATSDALRIEHSFRLEDFQPLVPGELVPAKVAIPSVAHAFRAGTRLRVTISSPGRDHGTWEFTPPDYGDTVPRQSIAFGADMPSRLVLPTIDGVEVAPGFPECPGLRGQPCRPYTPRVNTPAAP